MELYHSKMRGRISAYSQRAGLAAGGSSLNKGRRGVRLKNITILAPSHTPFPVILTSRSSFPLALFHYFLQLPSRRVLVKRKKSLPEPSNILFSSAASRAFFLLPFASLIKTRAAATAAQPWKLLSKQKLPALRILTSAGSRVGQIVSRLGFGRSVGSGRSVSVG